MSIVRIAESMETEKVRVTCGVQSAGHDLHSGLQYASLCIGLRDVTHEKRTRLLPHQDEWILSTHSEIAGSDYPVQESLKR